MILFPSPQTYDLEFRYLPWQFTIQKVIDIITETTPEKGNIIDLMCGNGYLLSGIKEKRPDLNLTGIDSNKEFIKYAESKNKNIEYIISDVLTYNYDRKFDSVICTGGLHHLTDKEKPYLINLAHSILEAEGNAVFADPYIKDCNNEDERKLNVLELGNAYIKWAIENNAPDEITKAAVHILSNDLLYLEYKTSLKKIRPLFEASFTGIKIRKIWPEDKYQYGDYIISLKK